MGVSTTLGFDYAQPPGFRLRSTTGRWTKQEQMRKKNGLQVVACINASGTLKDNENRHLIAGFLKFLQHLPSSQPIIIESGALLRVARPGLFVLVKNKNGPAEKPGLDSLCYPPDVVVNFENGEFDFDTNRIRFNGQKWTI